MNVSYAFDMNYSSPVLRFYLIWNLRINYLDVCLIWILLNKMCCYFSDMNTSNKVLWNFPDMYTSIKVLWYFPIMNISNKVPLLWYLPNTNTSWNVFDIFLSWILQARCFVISLIWIHWTVSFYLSHVETSDKALWYVSCDNLSKVLLCFLIWSLICDK